MSTAHSFGNLAFERKKERKKQRKRKKEKERKKEKKKEDRKKDKIKRRELVEERKSGKTARNMRG